MAILQQGSLGVFTGKVGALVISKWKDKYVGKSTPKPSAKKATDLQLSQQAKFRIAGEFMRMFRSEVHFSFHGYFGVMMPVISVKPCHLKDHTII
ncbi:hypothetical protein [Pedobacter sp. UYP1]|uniref:hypothetical protein n=1 Tax=Pedobacter sp. UYP1 TaxID=1756396 RepID=UPI003398179B